MLWIDLKLPEAIFTYGRMWYKVFFAYDKKRKITATIFTLPSILHRPHLPSYKEGGAAGMESSGQATLPFKKEKG